MSVGGALRTALVDFYHQSWRLLVLNTALSVVVLAILAGSLYYFPLVLLLALLVGPLAAALMHCAVTLAQTEELRLGEALTGLRLHWRRGLGLGLLVAGVVGPGIVALDFYARAGAWGWPLAVLAVYLLAMFGVLQLALWPLAVFERERAFRSVLADAALALFRRPAAFAALGLALLLVNALGALAVLPVLTLTVAYSFLTAAHFALPRDPMREAGTGG